MKETLYAQICDVLDLYKDGELHFSDTASRMEEVALNFAKGFGEWIDKNNFVLGNNSSWRQIENQGQYKDAEYTTDGLLTLYQEHLSLNKSEK